MNKKNQRLKHKPDSTEIIELRCLRIKLYPNLHRFHSIITLNITHNQISNISYFPKTLKHIYCMDNQLTQLPELPENLIDLWCSNNMLESLPSLPTHLKILKCGYNNLKSLPPLNNQLEILNCYVNELTHLPKLPETLQHLDCYGNKLVQLPPLNFNLKTLYFSNNFISEMPQFQLYHLDVHYELAYIRLIDNEVYQHIYGPNRDSSNYNSVIAFTGPNYIIRVLLKFKRCYYKQIIKQFMIHCIWVFRRPKLEEYFKPDNVLAFLEKNDGNIDSLDNM